MLIGAGGPRRRRSTRYYVGFIMTKKKARKRVLERPVRGLACTVGEKIRERRIFMRLSQSQLADAIGVTYQQIQKYEFSKNEIPINRMKRIADALDAPISYFLGESDNTDLNMLTDDFILLIDEATVHTRESGRYSLDIAEELGSIRDSIMKYRDPPPA